MARPERHDVDYFPFFAKRGKTLNILQSKFGLEGIGFFTNLLRFLALTPDHFYCIAEESDRLNFFAETGIQDDDKGIAMIELMVKTGKLDRELWEDHKVIVCNAFLESVEDAYERRSNKIITLDQIRAIFEAGGENLDNANNADINPENDDNNPAVCELLSKIDDNNPQTKLKESKEKETKLKDTCESDFSEPKNLFLHVWQHTPDVFNALARIESPNEWNNFWKNSGVTREQVKTALENFIADVKCGAIEMRYVPSMPDRFVLKGWITKCQRRFSPKTTAPPHGTSPPKRDLAGKASLSGLESIFNKEK